VKSKPAINMKRIFIAVKIEPGNNLVKMISSFKTGLKDERIKWTETENFHITLAFLGDTDEAKVKEIGKMLRVVCEGSGDFDIVIRGAGLFKNLKDPRVLWTGIDPSEELTSLHESVKLGLKDTGIVIEERNFSPHLTLGRIKSIRNDDTLRSLIDKYMNEEIQKQHVNEVLLFESILLHSGPEYKPLGKYPLHQASGLSGH
jgi:RNA 2',3'-cyclic 3'-phosphodiesterase